MRNLKRVLSLALAVVMVIGMMVMTTGAAESNDFADASEIKNTEAVEVMVALGVLAGDGTNYNPTSVLTREQAAKIICYMLMGPENAEKLAGVSTFTDVAANRWSAPFISYCASLGILAGNGDGTFNPTGELTGVAFAKMLLVALGYDAAIEGYVNNANWATNIATDAIEAGINVTGVDLAAAVNRDNAAQMAFNTLTANMVRYNSKGTNVTLSDGTSVIIGASDPAKYAEDGDHTPNIVTNDGKEGYQQFCEKYFPKLKNATDGTETDDFGRPAVAYWTLKNIPVYLTIDEPVATFTGKTMPAMIASQLNGYKLDVDGDGDGDRKIENVTETVGLVSIANLVNGNTPLVLIPQTIPTSFLANLIDFGTLVEFYADSNNVITRIVKVVYGADKINKITTDKTTGDVSYWFGVNEYIDHADEDIDDTVCVEGTVSVGDVVTYVLKNGVMYIYPTTSIVGTQTATKTDMMMGTTLTIDGKTYTKSTAANGGCDYGNQKIPYTYYLDQFGYVVYNEPAGEASTDYLQVMAVDTAAETVLGDTSYSVTIRALMADGTVGSYDLAIVKDGASTYNVGGLAGATFTTAGNPAVTTQDKIAQYDVFGYSLDNGVLTLEPLAAVTNPLTDADANKVFKTSAVTAVDGGVSYTDGASTVLLTADTLFVLYNTTYKTATTVTGYANLPTVTESNVRAVVKAGYNDTLNYCGAQVVFASYADGGLTANESDNYVYITHTDVTVSGKGVNTTYTYTGYTAAGSTVKVVNTYGNNLSQSGLYWLNNDNSVSTTPQTLGTSSSDQYRAKDTLTVANGMINDGTTWFAMDDNTKIVYTSFMVNELKSGVSNGIVVLDKDCEVAVTVYVLD